MTSHSISEIASAIGSPAPAHEAEISHLLTDSRSLLSPHDTLFFALRTPSGDGHNFISDLYTRGVRHFVVEHLPAGAASMPDANFLTVPSTARALQALGLYIRSRHDIPVVAITGSRGKTTVKEWAYLLLRDSFTTTRSPRSYNSQSGVPLSLWQITPATQLAIIEAGISQPGEMEKLSHIIRPTIGIFTNIGGAHSSGFSSIQEKCRQKAILLDHCHTAIYCRDNELIRSTIPQVADDASWSRTDTSAPLFITTSPSPAPGSTTITYTWHQGQKTGQLTIPFTSSHDLDNAIHCLALMLTLGIDTDVIATRMERLRPVVTRLDLIQGINGCHIVNDRFTADLPSLAQALDFTERRLTPGQHITLIIGDLIHSQEPDLTTYTHAATLCRQCGVGRIITVGHAISPFTHLFGHNARHFDSVDHLLASMSGADFNDELILLKGAPGSDFPRLMDMLEARQHETVLEINLDAVVHNFNHFRSLIRPTTGIVCMIKASGYGAGAGELAKTLQTQGASYLAVAVHDEGSQLRREGITMPIIVLNPMVDDFRTLFANRLEPEIYSITFLRRLIDEASRLGITGYPVHIKIDSGMHRLGFTLDTLPEVIDLLRSQTNVVPRSIFSHLCAADDPADDDYTRTQFDYFDRCCDMLLSAFPERRILRHILNSTGITRFPDHQLDMVRLGIGLYGVRTMHDGSQDLLRPVSTLRTVIISIKEWPAGTTIGYNRRGHLTRPSVIATVPIGYADGLNRRLGYGHASFAIKGHLAPIVGTICMDACMIDVTDIPGVTVGDSVEIFGDTISVDTLADTLGTIPYEILTSISDRVKRIYYRE